MGQLVFRSDDTVKWLDGYGSGKDGDYTPSTGTRSEIDASFTGSSGDYTGSGTNASFAAGQLVFIIDRTTGKYQFNKILDYNAGTITFKYPLTNNYTNAQIVVMEQRIHVNIQNGNTLSLKGYDNTTGKGGVYAVFAKASAVIDGTINGAGKGFEGGLHDASGVNWGGKGGDIVTGKQIGRAHV